MKISEAKKIVAHMCKHFFYHMELSEGVIPEKMDYSLEDMIKANKMVAKWNKRPIGRSGKKTMQMTVADRGIAAMYVCMNFKGDDRNADKMNSIAYANGNFAFILKE